MKRVILFCLLAILVFSGCTGVFSENEKPGQVRVGIVYDIGGKDDRSFNAAAWEGVKRARNELGIKLRDAEPGDPTSIEPSLRAFAELKYDLVIGVGFAQSPIIEQVAKDYPNVNFAIIDGFVLLPNVSPLLFKEHEGSFLVGMLAAGKSTSGKIGFVGGMDIPLIHKFAVGYEEGAKYVNPNIKIVENYVGITDAAWNNPAKGKELAKNQYENGCDVVFHAAGNSGMGVFDAAEETKKLAIGVDSNQNGIKPGFILTSMLKRVDVAVYSVIKDIVEKRFKSGIHVYGLENEGVDFAIDDYNRNLISPEAIEKVKKAKEDIISGKIKVTNAMEK
jgi:basic membrane protein A